MSNTTGKLQWKKHDDSGSEGVLQTINNKQDS